MQQSAVTWCVRCRANGSCSPCTWGCLWSSPWRSDGRSTPGLGSEGSCCWGSSGRLLVPVGWKTDVHHWVSLWTMNSWLKELLCHWRHSAAPSLSRGRVHTGWFWWDCSVTQQHRRVLEDTLTLPFSHLWVIRPTEHTHTLVTWSDTPWSTEPVLGHRPVQRKVSS